jgi:hypothetical protein
MQITLLKYAKKIVTFLIQAIRIQLFMTIMSMPILISWGMPISSLSIIGNIIFGPVLTIFLMLCSLIFLCELVHIPITMLVWCLNIISSIWLWILELPNNYWLVSFSTPPWWLLIGPACIALLSLYYKKSASLYANTFCMTILLIITILFLKIIYPLRTEIQKIPCNKGQVTLVVTPSTTILIDPGYIGQRISAPSWIEYTLIPHIIKTTGTNRIDTVIILQPNKTTFEALEAFYGLCDIKKIYIPQWDGRLPLSIWQRFSHLKQIAKAHHSWIKVYSQIQNLKQDSHCSIIIEPSARMIKKNDMQYLDHTVKIQLAHETETIYSASCTSKNSTKKKQMINSYAPKTSAKQLQTC